VVANDQQDPSTDSIRNAGSELTLVSGDGTRFLAFAARAAEPTDVGVILLPDVRGLHPYYRALTLRLAASGFDVITFDYFGRTAGVGWREDGFEYMPHVERTTFAGQSADLRAAQAYLSSPDGGGADRQFTLGFSLGGRLALISSTLDLGLEGVIAFYGRPVGPAKNDLPEPIALVTDFDARVLAIFGGADEGIPPDAVNAFATGLADAGVDHSVVVYPLAPHSFFDRRSVEFQSSADAAWRELVGFLRH
jgi:carboxymethylenebutenolidase